jgi:hypothetical protein
LLTILAVVTLYEIQGLYILFVFQILQLAFEDHAKASTPDTQVDDAPLPAESSSLPALCTTNDDPVSVDNCHRHHHHCNYHLRLQHVL